MHKKYLLMIMGVLGSVVTGSLATADEKIVEEVKLTREQCFLIAVENNREIRVSAFDPRIAETDITAAKGEFDLLFSARMNERHETTPRRRVYGSQFPFQREISVETKQFSTKLGAKLFTGGQIGVAFSGSRSESIATMDHPEYMMNSSITLMQPLLKNSGIDINARSIELARISKSRNFLEHRKNVEAVVAAVEKAYWALVLADEDLEVKKKSLEAAQKVHSQIVTRINAGHAAPIERFAGEAEVASREAEIISAENALKDAQDELLRLLNIDDGESLWLMRIVPTEKPTVLESMPDERESILLAMENRYDLHQLEKDIESAKIQGNYARNQILPQLDIQYTYGTNAIERSFNGGTRSIIKNEDDLWEFGITFSVPIGNRSAKSNYKKALLTIEKGEEAVELQKQIIEKEIRRRIRAVESSRKLVDALDKAVTFREKSAEAEEKKLLYGTSTNLQVFEEQRDLAIAESESLRAIISHRIAEIDFHVEQATFLKSRNINFEDTYEEKGSKSFGEKARDVLHW
ncbi:TolC family protein [Candidatus Hydrogenedentota bacterium]